MTQQRAGSGGCEFREFPSRLRHEPRIAAAPAFIRMNGVDHDQRTGARALRPDVRQVVKVGVQIAFNPDPSPDALRRQLVIEPQHRAHIGAGFEQRAVREVIRRRARGIAREGRKCLRR
jgi:hypothetical protein